MEKREYTREEQKELIVTASDGTEFFIASSSCDPGGCRMHSNICLTSFDDAIEFAKNLCCYSVFCYTWSMYVCHYKIIDGVATLIKEINLNDFVSGVIDEKDNFIDAETFTKEYFESSMDEVEKFKIVYKEIPSIKLTKPLLDKEVVEIVVPDEITEEIIKYSSIPRKDLSRKDFMYAMRKARIKKTIPDKQKYKFLIGHGYHWEDTSSLCEY
jgi:hypothetical protein